MRNKITFLVSSCDKYEDAWNPFFELLYIYTRENEIEFDYPIILNTETKQYSSSHFDVHVINTPGKNTWSERMANVLKQIDTEFVFLTLEDYFLKSKFDNTRFQTVINYMTQNPDVGIVDISPRYAATADEAMYYRNLTNVQDEFFVRDSPKFNICIKPAIWRKDFFIQLLRAHEDIWEFEYYSGLRAKKTDKKVVRYITQTPTIYEYDFQVWAGMGITRGQWLPGNVDYFAKHNIEVNFDRLGILDVSSLDDIKKLNRKSPKRLYGSMRRRVHTLLIKSKSLS